MRKQHKIGLVRSFFPACVDDNVHIHSVIGETYVKGMAQNHCNTGHCCQLYLDTSGSKGRF